MAIDTAARGKALHAVAQIAANRLGERRSTGTLLCDWSAAKGTLSKPSANAGEAFALDATTTFDGLPMVKCTFSSSTAGTTFQGLYTLSKSVHLGNFDTIQIPIRVTANNRSIIKAGTYFQIWIETAGGKTYKAQIEWDGLQPGVTNIVSVNRNSFFTFTGAAALTELLGDLVTRVRLVQATGAQDESAYPIWVGPIRFGGKAMPRCVIVADGQYISQYDYLRPLLDKYGFKASLAIVNNQIAAANRMTLAQLDEMYDDGHEVIHHTFTETTGVGWSDTTRYPTQADIEADINAGMAYISGQGWARGVGHAVHGYSYCWANTVGQARQLEVSAALRNCGVLTVRRSQPKNSMLQSLARPDGIDWYSLQGGVHVTNTDTGAGINTLIDRAIANGELLVITLHRLVLDSATPTGNEMKLSEAATWIDYLAQKRDAGLIRVTPQGQAYREITTGKFE